MIHHLQGTASSWLVCICVLLSPVSFSLCLPPLTSSSCACHLWHVFPVDLKTGCHLRSMIFKPSFSSPKQPPPNSFLLRHNQSRSSFENLVAAISRLCSQSFLFTTFGVPLSMFSFTGEICFCIIICLRAFVCIWERGEEVGGGARGSVWAYYRNSDTLTTLQVWLINIVSDGDSVGPAREGFLDDIQGLRIKTDHYEQSVSTR